MSKGTEVGQSSFFGALGSFVCNDSVISGLRALTMSLEERFIRQTSGALHALPKAGGLYQLRITAPRHEVKMINDSESAF